MKKLWEGGPWWQFPLLPVTRLGGAGSRAFP